MRFEQGRKTKNNMSKRVCYRSGTFAARFEKFIIINYNN